MDTLRIDIPARTRSNGFLLGFCVVGVRVRDRAGEDEMGGGAAVLMGRIMCVALGCVLVMLLFGGEWWQRSRPISPGEDVIEAPGTNLAFCFSARGCHYRRCPGIYSEYLGERERDS